MQRGRIASIQALRAVAAWAVVLGHAVPLSYGLTPSPTLKLFVPFFQAFAHAGVDLFFVISGAIMFIIAKRTNDATAIGSAVSFAVRRGMRIFPLFWITMGFTLWVGVGVFPTTPLQWIRELTLVDMPPAHPVAWTLVFEVRFYLMVAVMILFFHRRRMDGFFVLAIMMCATIFAAQYGFVPVPWLMIPLVYEFVFGIAVAALLTFGIPLSPLIALVLGVTWMGWSAVVLFPTGASVDIYRIAGYGIPAALILYGLIALESKGSLRVPRWLEHAGDASYSVYLWHFAIVVGLARVWPRGQWFSAPSYLVTTLLLSGVAAFISFKCIERPFIELAHWLTSRGRPGIDGAKGAAIS